MKHILITAALLIAGCAPKSQDANVDIFLASATGDDKAVEQFLDSGGDIDQTDPGGATPLIVAALYGQSDTVQLLLERGAALEAKNRDGATALHVAAFFCRLEPARLLLAAGADRNATNVRGERPLDTVAGEWSPGLSAIYSAIGSALELDIDVSEMERLRPQMADLLADSGS